MPWSSSSIKINIEDEKALYTNGDSIKGTLEVDVQNEIEVAAIDVKLRCNEIATVVYYVGSTAVVDTRQSKRVSQNIRVFPPAEIAKSSHQMRKGIHVFEFEFEIPSDISASIGSMKPITNNSTVEWYIKGIIRKTGTLKRNNRSRHRFEMHPLMIYPWNAQGHLTSSSNQLQLKVPKSGSKGFSLFSDAKNKILTTTTLELSAPRVGLRQGPSASGLQLLITCDHPELVSMKDLRLTLKRKTRINAMTVHHDYSSKLKLLEESDVNLRLDSEKGIEALRKRVSDICLNDIFTPNFETECFYHRYVVVAEATLVSLHSTWGRQRLKLEFPIGILSRALIEEGPNYNLASDANSNVEELPVYSKE